MVWTTSMKWKVISLFLIFFQLVQTLTGTPKAVCMDHGWPPSVCLFSSSSPTFFLSTCSLPDSSKSPTNTIPSILLKPSFQGYKHIIPSKSNVLCCSTKILLFAVQLSFETTPNLGRSGSSSVTSWLWITSCDPSSPHPSRSLVIYTSHSSTSFEGVKAKGISLTMD